MTVKWGPPLKFIPLPLPEALKKLDLKKFKGNKDYRHEISWVYLIWHVAFQIKQIRCARGLTQEELAKRLGTKQGVISKYESGLYEGYSIPTLTKIAGVFDCALMTHFETFGKMYAELKHTRENSQAPLNYEQEIAERKKSDS